MADVVLIKEEPRGPSQLIEIPVPAQAVSTVTLPTIMNLQSTTDKIIIIKKLRVIPLPVLATGPLQGLANAPLTELQKCSLVLYSQQWIKGQQIPLGTLIDVYVEGSGFPWKENVAPLDGWRDVDWNKSFIQYSNGTPSNGTAYEFIIEAEYLMYRPGPNGQLGQLIENPI